MFYGYSFCCCLLFLFLSFCLSSFPSSFSMNDFLCFLLSYFSFFKGICWRMGLLYGINASYIYFVIKVLLKWNCSISHIFLSVFVLIFFSILSNFIFSFAKIYWDRLPNLFFLYYVNLPNLSSNFQSTEGYIFCLYSGSASL